MDAICVGACYAKTCQDKPEGLLVILVGGDRNGPTKTVRSINDTSQRTNCTSVAIKTRKPG